MMSTKENEYPALLRVTQTFPASDNHAHPLLKQERRADVSFLGLVSEAHGSALDDAIHTLAGRRAIRQLYSLYILPVTSDINHGPKGQWNALSAARSDMQYEELCKRCFEPAVIACLLLDDGLGGVEEKCAPLKWHDRFTMAPTRRIVRIEVIAQVCEMPSAEFILLAQV
jgi:hypothetical protein